MRRVSLALRRVLCRPLLFNKRPVSGDLDRESSGPIGKDNLTFQKRRVFERFGPIGKDLTRGNPIESP